MRIKDHLIRFERTKIKFAPRDIWIGLYWDRSGLPSNQMVVYKFYICILPLFPVLIQFIKWKNYYKRFK